MPTPQWVSLNTGGSTPQEGRDTGFALAGDRLTESGYEPIAIHPTEEGHYWGHSAALNLTLCWEQGNLRFWDSSSRAYLPTFHEERANREAAESRAQAAEAEVQRLTKELQRRQSL